MAVERSPNRSMLLPETDFETIGLVAHENGPRLSAGEHYALVGLQFMVVLHCWRRGALV
jgi:hypothetical protein